MSETGVRAWLTGRVPGYLVPSRIVVVEALPLTSNGKVNRAALSALARTRPQLGTFVAPPAGRAQVVAGLWAQVLGLDRVGMQDNFFDLGGDSRSVAALVARINSMFASTMRVVDFMAAPTVLGVSGWLDRSAAHSPDDAATPTSSNEQLRQQAAARAALRTRRRQ